jgi:hypothetical protein
LSVITEVNAHDRAALRDVVHHPVAISGERMSLAAPRRQVGRVVRGASRADVRRTPYSASRLARRP